MIRTLASKSLRIFLIALLATSSSFGLDATFLAEGAKAPYEGYLLTPSKAKEVRQKLLDQESLQMINESLKRSLSASESLIKISDDKVKILEEQNDRLAKSLHEERSTSNLERILWFSLGIAATGVAGYVFLQATK